MTTVKLGKKDAQAAGLAGGAIKQKSFDSKTLLRSLNCPCNLQNGVDTHI